MDLFLSFIANTGYLLADYRHLIMIVIGSHLRLPGGRQKI